MKHVPTDIGQRIRALRTERGLSQADLARAVGISPAYACNIESGVARCHNVELMTSIAAELGVTLDYLVGNDPDQGSGQDIALYRAYLAQPNDLRQRVRAMAAIMMMVGEAA